MEGWKGLRGGGVETSEATSVKRQVLACYLFRRLIEVVLLLSEKSSLTSLAYSGTFYNCWTDTPIYWPLSVSVCYVCLRLVCIDDRRPCVMCSASLRCQSRISEVSACSMCERRD